MSAKTNIRAAVNAALAAHLATFTELAGVQIATAFEQNDEDSQHIRIGTTSRHMQAGTDPGSNYTVESTISVESQASMYTAAQHQAIVDALEAIIDALTPTEINTTAQGVTAYSVQPMDGADDLLQGMMLTSFTLEMEVGIT